MRGFSFKSSLLSALIVLALAGCVMTVPQEKSRYVGEWEGARSYLYVGRDGVVYYERLKGRFGSSSLEGNLAGFRGDNILVGMKPLTSTITVNEPPHQDGDDWRMVVNGEELLKIGN